MKDFKQLKIWQKGVVIALQAYKLIEYFPKEEKFGLSIQISRAAVSIASNIAEGGSKTSEKDYNRFLEMALGSCFELETQIIVAEKVNFGKKEARESLLNLLQEEQKMLISFMSRLEK